MQDAGRRTHEGLLAGLPVAERRLQLDGIDTVVLEGGRGPSLVLLHGGSPAGAALWAPVIAGLAEHHHVLAPHLPGLGESAPAPTLDAASVATWLAALLDRICQDRPALVTHSLPGGFAARFAAQHADRIDRLVLVATPALGRHRPPPALLLAALRLNLRPSRRNLERFARWTYLDPARTRADRGAWHDALEAYLLARAAVPHVKRSMRQLLGAGRRPIPAAELQRTGTPTALLWGRGDRMAPLNVAEATSATFGWPLHVIDDAGHLPHVEQPERFVDALERILHGG